MSFVASPVEGKIGGPPLPDLDPRMLWQSTYQILAQPPPPTVREILTAYTAKGDGDREMLLAMLNAKSAEDQRVAAIAALHRSMIELHGQSNAICAEPQRPAERLPISQAVDRGAVRHPVPSSSSPNSWTYDMPEVDYRDLRPRKRPATHGHPDFVTSTHSANSAHPYSPRQSHTRSREGTFSPRRHPRHLSPPREATTELPLSPDSSSSNWSLAHGPSSYERDRDRDRVSHSRSPRSPRMAIDSLLSHPTPKGDRIVMA